jgi:hypothetical protein
VTTYSLHGDGGHSWTGPIPFPSPIEAGSGMARKHDAQGDFEAGQVRHVQFLPVIAQ